MIKRIKKLYSQIISYLFRRLVDPSPDSRELYGIVVRDELEWVTAKREVPTVNLVTHYSPEQLRQTVRDGLTRKIQELIPAHIEFSSESGPRGVVFQARLLCWKKRK